MSLKVWIPFTKDLTQQGLSDVTITNNGATLDNNGKLGKCYNFTSTYVKFNKVLPNPCTQFSVCGWVKLLSGYTANNGLHLISFEESYGRICISKDGMAVRVLLNYNGTYSADGSLATASSITADVWNHYAVTFDSGTVKIYINGQLDRTYTATISQVALPQSVWKIGTYAAENSKGCVNDFRLYDSVLSPKEIEILSRGLVCHYPLNNNGNGQANLLKNSNFTEGSSGSQGYNFSATWTKQTDCMKIISTSAAAGLYTANYDSVTTGDMATFSAYVKADASMTIYIGVDGSGIGNCESFTVGTSWQRISISKAKTTNNANLRVYGNGTFYVRHMKYELGSIVTPWCPNSADSIYSSMGYSDTTEYDVSGYGNNGTKNKAMSYTSNTARYSVATIFDGNTDSINIGNMYQMLGSNTNAYYSIAVWTYKDSIGTKGYQTILGGGSGFEIEARNAAGTDPEYVLWNWGKLTGSYEFGKWTHMVFTKQDNVVKLYVNGVLVNEGTSTQGLVNSNYYIGSWNTATQQNFEGKMSDFRIYATALSDTQIAELYNTAVSVANNGTLMGYEFVEG